MSSRNIIINYVGNCLAIYVNEIDVKPCRLLMIYVLYWASDKLQGRCYQNFVQLCDKK